MKAARVVRRGSAASPVPVGGASVRHRRRIDCAQVSDEPVDERVCPDTIIVALTVGIDTGGSSVDATYLFTGPPSLTIAQGSSGDSFPAKRGSPEFGLRSWLVQATRLANLQ